MWVATSRRIVSCRGKALLSSLDEVGYIMIMFLTVNFIFASMGVIFFGKTDPMHFDGLQRAMMAVWQIETLDGWEDMLYLNMCATAATAATRRRLNVPHHRRTHYVPHHFRTHRVPHHRRTHRVPHHQRAQYPTRDDAPRTAFIPLALALG